MPVPWDFSSEQTAACLVCLVTALSVNFLILSGSILALLLGFTLLCPVRTYLERGLSLLGLGSFFGGQILPTLRTWHLPWRTHRLRLELQPLVALVCQGLRIYRARKSGDTQEWTCCFLGISQPMLPTPCARAIV